MGTFRNRIIEYGTKPADQFTANPRNPRLHPQFQREVMKAALEGLGWLAPVIENKRTGYLVDGHERVMQALIDNQPVPYVVVDLDESEEAEALATFDPITGLATYDAANLESLLHDIETDSPAIQQLLADLAAEHLSLEFDAVDENYSRKIDIPIYEPSNSKPDTSELFDQTKTNELLSQIRESQSLTDDEKSFLSLAAYRHTVFNFARIADLYAHGSPELQRLMENSGLVIIDFNRAIELGYVQLTRRITEIIGDLHDE